MALIERVPERMYRKLITRDGGPKQPLEGKDSKWPGLSQENEENP